MQRELTLENGHYDEAIPFGCTHIIKRRRKLLNAFNMGLQASLNVAISAGNVILHNVGFFFPYQIGI